MGLEELSLEQGGARIKFSCIREEDGPGQDQEGVQELKELSKGLDCLVKTKAAPIGPDGKFLGNCACLLEGEQILISRSGRSPEDPSDLERDFARVTSFDSGSWTAFFNSADADCEPSSDTPLHWFSLIKAPTDFKWKERPRVVLHGHSFETKEDAEVLGVPISPADTLFSTREDVDALGALLKSHAYPAHKAFIRFNHGFLILEETMDAAIDVLHALLSKRERALSL
ncbi:hypothetical protein HOP50_03g23520 [Chloropicon primus]|nr:hypothetical protein HOP50_03g23520 [Chloropicon primus]